MEHAVIKSFAGFLNTDGGVLLIGIGSDRQAVGQDHDYGRIAWPPWLGPPLV